MENRFAGETGREALVEALKEQKIVAGNIPLAEEIAACAELVGVPRGTSIIEQGRDESHVYLIVSGSFHIVVNGRNIARRAATDHIGEMAAIQPLQRRAASVVAEQDSVVIKLSEAQIAELGDRYPQIWRCFAKELAHRVEQRNKAATAVNETMRVFIIAPAASTEIAGAIKRDLEKDQYTVTIWTDSVMRGRDYSIEMLESALDQSDVALAIAGHAEKRPVRDDIIFELGFFMGRLGRHRTILIEPRGEALDLPAAELAGVNTLLYRHAGHADLARALAPVCDRLRTILEGLGPNR